MLTLGIKGLNSRQEGRQEERKLSWFNIYDKLATCLQVWILSDCIVLKMTF